MKLAARTAHIEPFHVMELVKRAAALAAEITGVRKNLLYQVALQRQSK